jgi:PQQ-dependent catabolism-associated CXXCW motif protein
MTRPILSSVLLLTVFGLPAAATPVPEPQGYWLGADHGATPDRITGGTVIHTAALAALIKRQSVSIIDVSAMPRRPEGLSPNTPWMPLPHSVISGAVWLPDLGDSVLSPVRDSWLRDRLAALSGRDRPLVLYCHPQCWRSWNAAKRAISFGHSQVYWYPDGIEGWQSAGLPTSRAVEEPPP